MFGEKIKNIRKYKRLTLQYVAKEIGVSVAYLSDLERGKKIKPKIRILYALAGLYKVDVDDICLSAGRIPTDVFYKITRCPELLEVVRKHKEI